MSNKIVKEMIDTEDDSYKKISSKVGIERFLRRNPNVGFSKIRIFLKENDVDYTKMGLSLLLKKMIRDGTIIKDHNTKRPTYRIRDEQWKDIEFQAEIFEKEIREAFIKNVGSVFGKNDMKMLNETLKRIGLYYLFTYLKSWNFVNTRTDVYENRIKWLKNTLPPKGFITLMDENVKRSLLMSGVTKLNTEKGTKFQKEKIKSLEEKLKKEFSKEFKVMDDIWNDLPNLAKKSDKTLWISAGFDLD